MCQITNTWERLSLPRDFSSWGHILVAVVGCFVNNMVDFAAMVAEDMAADSDETDEDGEPVEPFDPWSLESISAWRLWGSPHHLLKEVVNIPSLTELDLPLILIQRADGGGDTVPLHRHQNSLAENEVVHHLTDLTPLYTAEGTPRLPSLRRVSLSDEELYRCQLPCVKLTEAVLRFLAVYSAQLEHLHLRLLDPTAAQEVLEAALGCPKLRSLSLTSNTREGDCEDSGEGKDGGAEAKTGDEQKTANPAEPAVGDSDVEMKTAGDEKEAEAAAMRATWKKQPQWPLDLTASAEGLPQLPHLLEVELRGLALSDLSWQAVWDRCPNLRRCLVVTDPPARLSRTLKKGAATKGLHFSVEESEAQKKVWEAQSTGRRKLW